MMRFVTFFITIFIVFVNVAYAVSDKAKEKYPYPLLNDDHGILSENDLASFTWGLKPKKFTSSEGTTGPYNYWQCFPREQVMVTLSDMGHSSDELGWKKNVASLGVDVLTNKDIRDNEDIKHTYEMRAHWTIAGYQKRFNKWLKLMEGEKYVCLAG